MTEETKKESEGGVPKIAIAVVVAIVVAVVVFVVLSQKKSYEPMVAGKEALEFALPDLDGKPVSLKEHRGKVVFLNFWATWCKPCEEEMPSLQALHEQMAGKPFVILAASVDSEGPEVVKAYAAKYGLTFKILHDKSGRTKEAYKTTGVPETFIIDQNGVIAEKVWGPRDWAQSSSITTVAELLDKGPGKPESYSARKAAH